MPPTLHLLTLNCHEAWVHQLGWLPARVTVIDGLPNRPVSAWDRRIRPVPDNATLVTLAEAHALGGRFDCLLCHSLSDLLAVKALPGPRILMLHNTLAGRIRPGDGLTPEQVRGVIRHYMTLVPILPLAVSAAKRDAWGLGGEVVENAVAVAGYPPWRGDLAAGIRVANQITAKAALLDWPLHQAAFSGLPVTLVGLNPDLDGVSPARDWADLKARLSHHRFYIHTAAPGLEDGFNMALLEAMAAGLPVVGNPLPDSPVVHGVSGLLGDRPEALRAHARLLLEDRALAGRLGAAAREAVAARFAHTRWRDGMLDAIQRAQRLWATA